MFCVFNDFCVVEFVGEFDDDHDDKSDNCDKAQKKMKSEEKA